MHVAGHPPGALTFFVALDRVGLGSGLAAGLVVTLIAASTSVAVLLTMRVLGAEQHARLAAPFLVIGPAAIWQCVSADAMFAAWSRRGGCARSRWPPYAAASRWSVVAGLLLGWCVMTVLRPATAGVAGRGGARRSPGRGGRSCRRRSPPWRSCSRTSPFGYAWWEALPVLRERYWDGVAHNRPPEYWMWGNLAALVFSAGPARLRRRRPHAGPPSRPLPTRVVWWLVAAGTAMVVVADLSQMSRAEVERIWLPFVPWLLIGCALLPERWRRCGPRRSRWSWPCVVQHLLATGW